MQNRQIIPASVWIPENVVLDSGNRIRLERWQRKLLDHALAVDGKGCLKHQTYLLSMIKKSGKTELLAAIGLWVAFEFDSPGAEVICCANDEEQSIGRVFKDIKRSVEKNPVLMSRVESITKNEITLKDGGSIKAIASEYAGAAGANPSATLWDELWAYTSERSRRLWDELTPPPTRRSPIRVIGTYAGFSNESDLLWSLYERGKKGRRVIGLYPLPVWDAGPLLMLWDHKPRMPWQTKAYYEAQRQELRPSAYGRLHENEWVSAESAFISAEMWDSCVDKDHVPPLPDKGVVLYAGCDASVKRDRSAVVSVYRQDGKVKLGPRRVWQPSKDEPMDLERTMEAYVLELREGYSLGEVLYDPFQFHRSATTLREKGCPMQEYPQTVGNMTDAGSALFDLIKHRQLVVYPDKDLRQEAMNAVAKESTRGITITKEKASHKIDSIVALAMACVDAAKASEPCVGGDVSLKLAPQGAARQDWGTGGVTSYPDYNMESYLSGGAPIPEWKLRELGLMK